MDEKRQLTLDDLLRAKERDMLEVPGFAPPFSPEEAETAGAFVDDAVPIETERERGQEKQA